MLLLSLNAIGGLAELVDRVLQPLLDLLVGRDTCRERDRPAPADELVVDLASGFEGVADVRPQLLVVHRTLDVRSRAARLVQ